jgi:hypothetical protein
MLSELVQNLKRKRDDHALDLLLRDSRYMTLLLGVVSFMIMLFMDIIH